MLSQNFEETPKPSLGALAACGNLKRMTLTRNLDNDEQGDRTSTLSSMRVSSGDVGNNA